MMEPLGDELRSELARFGPQGSIGDTVAAWPEAVGAEIARHAWPARFTRDGKRMPPPTLAIAQELKIYWARGQFAMQFSYLNEELCQRGCGADRCEEMVPLRIERIVNLGEPDRPMNGSLFISSSRWPLREKMESTNFPARAIARLEALPDLDIAWSNAGRHPAQSVIAAGGSTQNGIARGGRDTDSALATAGDSTDVAISVAKNSTGNALGNSYRKTVHALGTASRKVGNAVGGTPKTPE